MTVNLRYDRAGRSNGTAFVTYSSVADARTAIKEFDGANAKGQPIRLTLLPSGPGGGRGPPAGRRDNPFDRVENPRSLFDRVEAPKDRRGGYRSASPSDDDSYGEGAGDNSRRRGLRRGPTRDRRSDVSKPAPENIDRYVPGQSGGRSPRQRSSGREGGRRPGERRERGGGRGGRGARSERGDGDVRMVNGRPRKTQEELDAEMEDYWDNANAHSSEAKVAPTASTAPVVAAPMATAGEEDIDMIE